MFRQVAKSQLLSGAALCVLTSSCAIQSYPGQPGVKTNGFAKIDVEYLDVDGLWTYEVSYDNSPNGGGVEQIVTKLYPNALTYTSNVRTNSDGTTYRHKHAYKGAQIQMISLPKQGTILVPPDSRVTLIVDTDKSLDEVDDRNISEDGLFSRAKPVQKFIDDAKFKWDLLRAGTFSDGNIQYSMNSVKLGNEIWDMSAHPIGVSTTLSQKGITLQASAEQKAQFGKFLLEKYPNGYRGPVEISLAHGPTITMSLTLNTLETLKNSGKKVIVQDLNSQTSSQEGK